MQIAAIQEHLKKLKEEEEKRKQEEEERIKAEEEAERQREEKVSAHGHFSEARCSGGLSQDRLLQSWVYTACTWHCRAGYSRVGEKWGLHLCVGVRGLHIASSHLASGSCLFLLRRTDLIVRNLGCQTYVPGGEKTTTVATDVKSVQAMNRVGAKPLSGTGRRCSRNKLHYLYFD